MKLLNLRATRYRSLREETIPLGELNLFIGANASGKSTILDALRFLHEGVIERDFRPPVDSRGGIVHLAWKGEEATQIELVANFEDVQTTYNWSVRLTREGHDFSVRESLHQSRGSAPPLLLLEADRGRGWWLSGTKGDRVVLAAQPPTICALAAASVDQSFPARYVCEYVGRWGFYDPSPYLLRRDWSGLDPSRFDPYGRNLAERLLALRNSSPDALAEIVSATQTVLGLPSMIELRESRNSEDRVDFILHERGLKFPVQQVSVSSGTLRILALMTAFFGEAGSNLIGIEEPENYLHPTASAAFAQCLLMARDRVQVLVTTHSPLLLDCLNEPAAVHVVRRSDERGTYVTREANPQAVAQALKASGFGLGEFYAAKGFGA
jgi:predicted ATPase